MNRGKTTILIAVAVLLVAAAAWATNASLSGGSTQPEPGAKAHDDDGHDDHEGHDPARIAPGAEQERHEWVHPNHRG